MEMALVPLVMVAMNIVYALTAYPCGVLSDRIGHRSLLAGGICVLILSDLLLATSNHWLFVISGVGLWGVHLGMTQGLLAAMVAEHAPRNLFGTAYGFFNLVTGLALLIASLLAGIFWDRVGAASTFVAGGAFCALALIALAFCPLKKVARSA